MLRSIYGHGSDPVYCNLEDRFSYVQWRDAFFTDVPSFHQKFDSNTLNHNDPRCFCHKSIKDWLFKGHLQEEQQQWHQDFIAACYLDQDAPVDSFLESLKLDSGVPANPKRNRLFACVAKTLKNNLKDLAELGYLDYEKTTFYKRNDIEQLYQPSVKVTGTRSDFIIPIINEELSEIPTIFQEKVGDIQRFFMHVDYAVAKKDLDNDFPYMFRDMWQENPFPIVRLEYDSVSLHRQVKRIIHPVCIYYYQRALYLCGYGQTPKRRDEIDWYNYRIDRIRNCEILDWSDTTIPPLLKQQGKELCTPDYIEQQLCKAFGFDFYKPQKTMVLRFNQEFSEKYIDESFRHETFNKFNNPYDLEKWQESQSLLPGEKEKLYQYLKQWNTTDPENPTHSYYRMDYRVDDNNVIMRLRAWGPNVEVLFPPQLRQRMADDSQTMAALYQ